MNENNAFYSSINLPKINDGAYVKNHHEYESIGTHYIDLYVNGNNIFCFLWSWIYCKR